MTPRDARKAVVDAAAMPGNEKAFNAALDDYRDALCEHAAEQVRAAWQESHSLRMAAADALQPVEEAIRCIRDMNFGEARQILAELVEDGLPNDHGGPVTHYPFLERRLAKP